MDFFSRKNRILLKELIKTDFKLRYQGSAIGYLWSILKPLMLFAIMYIVFVRFLPLGGRCASLACCSPARKCYLDIFPRNNHDGYGFCCNAWRFTA